MPQIDFTEKMNACAALRGKASGYKTARDKAIAADGLAQGADFYAQHAADLYATGDAAQKAMISGDPSISMDPAVVLAPLVELADKTRVAAEKKMADADAAAV